MVDRYTIQVVFAPGPGREQAVSLEVASGSTVGQAIEMSNLGIQLDGAGITPAVWGKAVPLDALVQAGDRIELCRPLLVDPKLARARRAATRAAKKKTA